MHEVVMVACVILFFILCFELLFLALAWLGQSEWRTPATGSSIEHHQHLQHHGGMRIHECYALRNSTIKLQTKRDNTRSENGRRQNMCHFFQVHGEVSSARAEQSQGAARPVA
jgi:hypothetical protein